jgi:UDP-2,4-diacetamido-2,4,6-trideoxy-beta-L-altropyranose hydrolase
LKVVFRVDASLKMGTGHVMRCLTLAQVLKENGADVKFICRKHEGNLIDKVRSSGFNVYELEVLKKSEVDNKLEHSHWLGATQEQDVHDCINTIKSKETDWLIVDHYALDEQWQKSLKPYYKKIMVIDDLADRKHQCDILLDQTFGRQHDDYVALVPKDCELLLGSQYALLRPEFSKWRVYSLERRSKSEFKKLLVNMGGVDVDNITENILDELKICNLPNDINIIVVMGGAAPHLKSVKLKADILPYKIEVKVDIDNMAEIMANSDIAIGASGSTTWERCCLGLPTIQIVIAENQNIIAKSLVRNNAIKIFQDRKELSGIISDATNWMISVSDIARQISDGLGSMRVMKVIIDRKL